jgi:glucose-1-phosphate cytidylyltransferase
VDTGQDTGTGGRLLRVAEYLDETFCMTYGDGVSNLNIRASIDFHRKQGVLATLTSVQPPARFGSLDFDESGTRIRAFKEKKDGSDSWVNGGFFVMEPQALTYIKRSDQMWEFEPMETLAREKQLAVFQHHGFWRCMDHLSDRMYLEKLWESGDPPWKVWE